jgi:small subunit ribosomal protein S18
MTSEPQSPDSEQRGGRDDRRDDRGGRDDRRGGGGGGGRGGGGRGGFRRPRGCEFCRRHVDVVDYKDVELLKRYVTDRGKMDARRKVGTCAKHQRVVAQAVKRARHVALLPYTAEHVRASGINMGRR